MTQSPLIQSSQIALTSLRTAGHIGRVVFNSEHHNTESCNFHMYFTETRSRTRKRFVSYKKKVCCRKRLCKSTHATKIKIIIKQVHKSE